MPKITPDKLGESGADVANRFSKTITSSILDHEDQPPHMVLALGLEVLVDFAKCFFTDPEAMFAAMHEVIDTRAKMPLAPGMVEFQCEVRAAGMAEKSPAFDTEHAQRIAKAATDEVQH